ncbi:MAG: hypothetical protein ACON3Z_01365 [Bradymonadia bacterium]
MIQKTELPRVLIAEAAQRKKSHVLQPSTRAAQKPDLLSSVTIHPEVDAGRLGSLRAATNTKTSRPKDCLMLSDARFAERTVADRRMRHQRIFCTQSVCAVVDSNRPRVVRICQTVKRGR